MKKLCFQNMFATYYFKWIPKIRYITQSKETDEVSEFCFKNLLDFLKNVSNASSEFDEKVVYVAVTHDLIIKRLKRIPDIRIWYCRRLRIKASIEGLKKYVIGDMTRCIKCDEITCCRIYKYFNEYKAGKVYDYFVIIKKRK